MRSVPIEKLAEESEQSTAELLAGRPLELTRNAEQKADVNPTRLQRTLEQTQAARETLWQLLHDGLDSGGTPFKYDERHER